jgi:hypothetical protein
MLCMTDASPQTPNLHSKNTDFRRLDSIKLRIFRAGVSRKRTLNVSLFDSEESEMRRLESSVPSHYELEQVKVVSEKLDSCSWLIVDA